MASCDAQGGERRFFPQPFPTRNNLQGLPTQGSDSVQARAIQAVMTAVSLHAQAHASPSGKNGSQETHSLLFTCIKANKSLASTSKQEKRIQILKST